MAQKRVRHYCFHFTVFLFSLLVEARQNLGLFQHHDGITGTAKDHVVIDYGDKLMRSVKDTKKVCTKLYSKSFAPVRV